MFLRILTLSIYYAGAYSYLQFQVAVVNFVPGQTLLVELLGKKPPSISNLCQKECHIHWQRQQHVFSSNIIVTQFDGTGQMVFLLMIQNGSHGF